MSDRAAGEKWGTLGGAAVGTYLGGPLGGVVGGYGGKLLGGALGGLFGGSDAPPPDPYLTGLKTREQQAYDQQQQLSAVLMGQSLGQGPSLAGLQLGQGLDQINRASLAQAAGASGQGGVLARYAAMQAASTAGAQENQQQALVRADEINKARALLGQNLGNQANESTGMYGAVTGAANTAHANDIAAKKNDEDFGTKLLGAGLNAYSSYGAAQAAA